MAEYNPKSLKAQEFIHDGEILATLEYAEANKNNIELINEILEKARPKKTEEGCVCAGLTHREASVLLACDDPAVIERIYEIVQQFAGKGNRWYDSDPVMLKAVELLRLAPPETQRKAALKLLTDKL